MSLPSFGAQRPAWVLLLSQACLCPLACAGWMLVCACVGGWLGVGAGVVQLDPAVALRLQSSSAPPDPLALPGLQGAAAAAALKEQLFSIVPDSPYKVPLPLPVCPEGAAAPRCRARSSACC